LENQRAQDDFFSVDVVLDSDYAGILNRVSHSKLAQRKDHEIRVVAELNSERELPERIVVFASLK
jgi:hypothetical protein